MDTTNNKEDEVIKEGATSEEQLVGIYKAVKDEIKNNFEGMSSDIYFATFVRDYFLKSANRSEFSEQLKKYDNNYRTLSCHLGVELNHLMDKQEVESPAKKKTMKELNDKKYQLQVLKEKMDESISSINPLEELNNSEPKGRGRPKKTESEKLSEQWSKLSDSISLLEKRVESMPSFELTNCSYQGKELSSLLEKLNSSLLQVKPDSTPSDLEARKSATFEKKMDLNHALFTLLFNTRPQTLPISVLNLKGWSARFVKRLKDEKQMTNLPTVLFFRSRMDGGRQKGNSGKSTISASVATLLQSKGLNVADQNSSIKMPTIERVSKEMSDKTFIAMEDVSFNEKTSWEDLNNFCDGVPIMNRGKYEKEGYIMSFGNVIATTNYDLNYANKKRYPVVEFSTNDMPLVSKDPLVLEHAKYKRNDAKREYDFSDAWETLFSYAIDNEDEWLYEYENEGKDVAKSCRYQKTNIEQLVESAVHDLCDGYNTYASQCHKDYFTISQIAAILKENPLAPKKINAVEIDDALISLKVQQKGKNKNPYMKTYLIPTTQQDECDGQCDEKSDVEKVYDYFFNSGKETSK